MVRAKITKTVKSEGSEKDVEIANGVEVDPFEALKLQEQDHDVSDRDFELFKLMDQIKFRTLSWQKTTMLLFTEYVCLAILALSWSWSVLGWVAGFFITFGMGIITWCKCCFRLSEPR